MSKQSLNGKVVLIAGGAKNLGGLVARDLAAGGAAAVVVHYNSDATRAAAEETLKAVNAAGAKAILVQGDLTQPANVAHLFEEAIKAFGKVDIAVNTAGLVIKKPIAEVTEADYDSSFDINSKAAFFFIQQAGKHLADNGRIVSIVSSLLAAYTPFYAVYPGSKAPVEHFTRAASKEFGERGISVNAIGPGPMDTPFFYGQESKEAVAYHSTAAALSKFSKTGLTDIEDIAPIVKFLVTDGWWITGQTLFANGGYTTR
ncbi:MAG: SDR family oxidoreductase [Serratia proteamaculans]|jgi:NAD(P)-dependent dehydrogenase (short-subunit alcohol dehydrogenase family)|uniref:SDR family oxidoreductase n=1 Tax=Serratia proteamaculans TaxID=28151 RepID=A0ABS0TP46_SERPR|nr:MULTISPECIES: SDR family oxidoreductase [Serratia]SPZ55755.1 Glucose 1-dehydrogenase [Serratia quinivorans]HCV65816.1 short chain dehydrogenase [Serratia sp. (in: enterobacteria)]KAB1499130.1 SDR family oxidoreductase [Serratia proteamaculans]MBI6179714.1 SDR family oxidoreductase [Serratia proteamaculans]NWA71865.1 SDR family oxidoreductase [Serratia proteamaculans]